MKKNTWIIVLAMTAITSFFSIKFLNQHNVTQFKSIDQQKFQPKPTEPSKSNITNKTPTYLDYHQIVTQLKEWQQQAPALIEIGTYGKSAKNVDIYYIRVRNKFDNISKPKVLITACIHGNEPWCTGVVMGYIGNMVGSYGENKEITDLINSRDLYFVPVVSPDSYPHSRHVNGVDPNRNFPGPSRQNLQSIAPIQAIMDFFNQIKPNAVISGHTHGRVFLMPYGDKNQTCPNDAEFKQIMVRVADMCQYKLIRACQMYGTPIHGTEVDWYYRNGAFSIIMEMGTHQHIPTKAEIDNEFNRTFRAVLYFIKEAPLVEIKPVNRDSTPKALNSNRLTVVVSKNEDTFRMPYQLVEPFCMELNQPKIPLEEV